jgi:hypothetical protein
VLNFIRFWTHGLCSSIAPTHKNSHNYKKWITHFGSIDSSALEMSQKYHIQIWRLK